MRILRFFATVLKLPKTLGRRFIGKVTGTKEITSQNTEKKGGQLITTIVNVKETFNNMSRAAKLGIGLYSGGIVTYNLGSSYNAGVSALRKYRSRHGEDFNEDNAWNAVYKASREESISTAFCSLFWPFSIASKMVPSLVMVMNHDSSSQD